jgi:hypothetical protein
MPGNPMARFRNLCGTSRMGHEVQTPLRRCSHLLSVTSRTEISTGLIAAFPHPLQSTDNLGLAVVGAIIQQ